jgi:hypothetical protein
MKFQKFAFWIFFSFGIYKWTFSFVWIFNNALWCFRLGNPVSDPRYLKTDAKFTILVLKKKQHLYYIFESRGEA